LPTEAHAPDALAQALVKEEGLRQVLSSLVVCFFAREIYKPETVLRALRAVGFNLDAAQLEQFGRRVHAEKFRFKMREGFSFENLRIPKRILEIPAFVKDWDEALIRDTIGCVRKTILDIQEAHASAS
jgi:aldehyde:ferredoxin oxidoreductase